MKFNRSQLELLFLIANNAGEIPCFIVANMAKAFDNKLAELEEKECEIADLKLRLQKNEGR